MHRFFHPHLQELDPASAPSAQVGREAWIRIQPPAPVTLDEAQSRHLVRVLRLQTGDTVELFDGAGLTAKAAVATVQTKPARAHVSIEHVRRSAPDKPLLTIAAALPKGARADNMVHQLTQLGADRLIPLSTEHSIVEPRPAKLERLRRSVIESCKQCGRSFLMHIDDPATLDTVLANVEETDCRLIASPDCDGDAINSIFRDASRVLVFVGPEGGWTPDELANAIQRGCSPWQLGPHVLRVETAATAAAAVIRYLTNRPAQVDAIEPWTTRE